MTHTRTPYAWADLPNTGLQPHGLMGFVIGWQAQDDLAKELAGHLPNLPWRQARTLIELTHAGLPIVLGWRQSLGVNGVSMDITTTVIVDQLFPPSSITPGYVHVRYIGFGHPVDLDHITVVKVPDMVVV